MAKKPAGKGHSAKHAGHSKHVQGQGKHHPKAQHKAQHQHHAHQQQKVHTVAKGHKGHKARGLALGSEVACCTAEALAASLRLSGRPVSDGDVLRLYERTEGASDTGAPILAALEAAARFGLGGVRPGSFRAVDPAEVANHGSGLVLGLELPGAHTVLATPAGWWSWGELHCPCEWPGAVAEEAWAVMWP
jgi:hypothetical protein